MSEAFQPIAIRPTCENRMIFWVTYLLDLQLLTIFRFFRLLLSSSRGCLLDVGAGESTWRDLLLRGVGCVSVYAGLSQKFWMRYQSNNKYYEGKRLLYDNNSFDHLPCAKVRERGTVPRASLTDLSRVPRVEGTLTLTLPCSERLHHLPHDYGWFSRVRLIELWSGADFTSATIHERGNDIAVFANKLIVLLIRLLRPQYWFDCACTWVLALRPLPLTCVFLGSAH